MLRELRVGRAWKPLGHSSLDALLRAEIGVGLRQSQHVVALRARGRPRKGAEKGDNITFSMRGTHAAYLQARLKRDAPEIAERLRRAEYPSTRAAAIAAGISHRKP